MIRRLSSGIDKYLRILSKRAAIMSEESVTACASKKTDEPVPSASTAGVDRGGAEDYVEAVVCGDADVADGEMKAFPMADVGKVLVVRQNGVLSALGSKCTHYGAPLETGALGDGRVRCPWHGACFNVRTGDIEDFPGVDSLPCFDVSVNSNNEVVVRAKRADVKSSKRVREMATPDANERAHVVIVGGGPSGNACAETLRQHGFAGKITLLCGERHLPYDRVKISKMLDAPIEQLQLRDDAFYARHAIDVRRAAAAVALDVAGAQVVLADGARVPYTRLYVATGSSAARPPIAGADAPNVHTLRDHDDARRVHATLADDQDVVVLGASFVAMEAAAYCAGKARSVTVVGRDARPFQKLLGAEIGAAVQTLFEGKGVRFAMRAGVAEFVVDGGVVRQARLTTGETLDADVVILGTGATPNTAFLRDSGVAVDAGGVVEVDEFLRTSVPDVYAGGDIAGAPVWACGDRKAAIGHFGLAQYHGRVAGLNIAGQPTPLRTVPFFWTMLFGHGIRYCGHGAFDDILYAGDVPGLKFAAYFLDGDVVTAVSTCAVPGAAEFANRAAAGRKLYRRDLGDDCSAWMSSEKTSL